MPLDPNLFDPDLWNQVIEQAREAVEMIRDVVENPQDAREKFEAAMEAWEGAKTYFDAIVEQAKDYVDRTLESVELETPKTALDQRIEEVKQEINAKYDAKEADFLEQAKTIEATYKKAHEGDPPEKKAEDQQKLIDVMQEGIAKFAATAAS